MKSRFNVGGLARAKMTLDAQPQIAKGSSVVITSLKRKGGRMLYDVKCAINGQHAREIPEGALEAL
jgi:hypothetical protein